MRKSWMVNLAQSEDLAISGSQFTDPKDARGKARQAARLPGAARSATAATAAPGPSAGPSPSPA